MRCLHAAWEASGMEASDWDDTRAPPVFDTGLKERSSKTEKVGFQGRCVAEEVGFEPTEGFRLRRFSRPVQSTALPLLRGALISPAPGLVQQPTLPPFPRAPGPLHRPRRRGWQRAARRRRRGGGGSSAGAGRRSSPRGSPAARRAGEERAGGIASASRIAPAPGAFLLEGEAARDGPDGAAGLWAAVGGLPRPERALIVNTATGARSWWPSFAAGAGPPIRLSNAAADALGIGGRAGGRSHNRVASRAPA